MSSFNGSTKGHMGSNGSKIGKYTWYTYQKNANYTLIPNSDIPRSFELISRVKCVVSNNLPSIASCWSYTIERSLSVLSWKNFIAIVRISHGTSLLYACCASSVFIYAPHFDQSEIPIATPSHWPMRGEKTFLNVKWPLVHYLCFLNLSRVVKSGSNQFPTSRTFQYFEPLLISVFKLVLSSALIGSN